jgi:hypothetical protein
VVMDIPYAVAALYGSSGLIQREKIPELWDDSTKGNLF